MKERFHYNHCDFKYRGIQTLFNSRSLDAIFKFTALWCSIHNTKANISGDKMISFIFFFEKKYHKLLFED